MTVTTLDQQCISTLRFLPVDMVQKASSDLFVGVALVV
jgi:hypothetical protein